MDKAEDILEDKLQWELARKERITQPSIFDFGSTEVEEEPKAQTSELGAKLLELLQVGSLPLEKLVEDSGADFASVSMELLELQGVGLVGQNQAMHYYRR